MDYPIRTVCVVGLGYIGLPTAATLASRGVEVIGVDINPQVVDAVDAGQPYFSAPDLDMLLRAATTLGKLRATSRPEPADAFVIAVPTPFNADRSPNLDSIDAHSRFRKIPREELMRRVVIDVTGLTHGYG